MNETRTYSCRISFLLVLRLDREIHRNSKIDRSNNYKHFVSSGFPFRDESFSKINHKMVWMHKFSIKFLLSYFNKISNVLNQFKWVFGSLTLISKKKEIEILISFIQFERNYNIWGQPQKIITFHYTHTHTTLPVQVTNVHCSPCHQEIQFKWIFIHNCWANETWKKQ